MADDVDPTTVGRPVGMVTVCATIVANEGPLFKVSTEYVTASPVATDVGPLTDVATSATGVTVRFRNAELFVASGSDSLPVTSARICSGVVPGATKVMVLVVEVPEASGMMGNVTIPVTAS